MSTDEEATTGYRFVGGAPAEERQGPRVAGTSQEPAVQSFEGMDSIDVAEDNQFDKMQEEDARLLTNMEKFFDEPVWRKVLGKLEKKDDIENSSNASLFFGELLEEERARKVVLPKVFEILHHRYLTENEDDSYKETNVKSIPWKRPAGSDKPHQMTGIWKCRLVSKKWNEAIEEIYRNEDAAHYQMHHDFPKAKNFEVGSIWGKEYFDEELAVSKFLDKFETTHYDCVVDGITRRKCPFLGRSVRILYVLVEEERNQAYFDGFMKMLVKFGEEVSYFEFICSWWEILENVVIYQKLKKMVERMPDLKVLRFTILHCGDEKEQGLEEEIERNPFPQLAKLEMISLNNVSGQLSNHLVNQNRHITRLEVGKISLQNAECLIFTNNLLNLTHLSLTVKSLEILEAFESYPFRLKLQKLYFLFGRDVPFVPWSRVFSAIQAKCDLDLCTDLTLKMPEPQTDVERKLVLEESLEWRLSFGKIERFSLKLRGRYCLDFLLPSKNSLEAIWLICDESYEDTQHDKLKDEQVIKFFGYENKMQESNIAKELPRLKEFRVRDFGRKFIPYFIEEGGVVKSGGEQDW